MTYKFLALRSFNIIYKENLECKIETDLFDWVLLQFLNLQSFSSIKSHVIVPEVYLFIYR